MFKRFDKVEEVFGKFRTYFYAKREDLWIWQLELQAGSTKLFSSI